MSECEHGPGCMCGRGSPILRTPRATRKPLMLTPEALAARDRENRAIGWDQGFEAGEQDVMEHNRTSWSADCSTSNPYRGDKQ